MESNTQLKPFDYLKSINSSKKNLMEDEQCEKIYNPFLMNRGLSYHNDTIMYAELMNRSTILSNRMQYNFYLSIVRKRNRFSKWYKPEKEEKIKLVEKFYNCSYGKAKVKIQLLSDEQLKIIKKKLDYGGR